MQPAVDFAFAAGDWFNRNASAFSALFAAAVAGFTFYLAYTTSNLWRATREVADAAKQSADTASEAFTKLERPYVYIFGVNRFEGSPNDSPARVGYSVANYGKTPATIEAVIAGISFFEEPLPGLVVDYRDDDRHDLLVRPILPPGDVRHLFVDAPDNLPFTPGMNSYGDLLEVSPQLERGQEAFVWLQIRYRGPIGDVFESSACWRYDHLTNRLIACGDHTYNYVK